MPWADYILTIVSGYAAYRLIGFAKGRGRLKFLGLTIAAFLFTVIELTIVINGIFDSPAVSTVVGFIVEWGHLICLAFILSSLAVFIRESKPVFARFPLVYTALPLFIVISYFFVLDSMILRRWLFYIYQGGALLVALLMYGVYAYRSNKYFYILGGIVLIFICYLLYWNVPALQTSVPWVWKLLLSAGILTTVFGYQKAHH